jgi:hypothetical protein
MIIRKKKTIKRHTRKNTGINRMKDITIGILAWNSRKTLTHTLNSYKQNGLLDIVHPFIYFQERTPELDAYAATHGINDVIGTPENRGIFNAFLEMLLHTKTKYFIFAECDFELIHGKRKTIEVLSECIRLMEEKNVDVIRLRDKKDPGDPLHSLNQIKKSGKELQDHDFGGNYPWKLETLHFIKDPVKKFPGDFEKVTYKNEWLIDISKDVWWTNNITIIKMDFAKKRLIPMMTTGPCRKGTYEDDLVWKLEHCFTSELKNYRMAGGVGLFRHNRLDRH